MSSIWNQKWTLTMLAGLLLGLSFPPVNWSWLSIPAFICLFRVGELCTTYKEVAWVSYIGFVTWNVITTYWLMMASVFAGIAAILANSAIMTIPICVGIYVSRTRSSPYLVSLLQAAAWVSYEYLHHHWDLAWPWLAIGNGWANHISLIQYISITGHLGVSFWVVLVAALTVQLIKSPSTARSLAVVGMLIFFPLISMVMWSTKEVASNGGYTSATVIQPNHDSYQDLSGFESLTAQISSLYSITDSIRTDSTQLIVWPENAIDRAISPNTVRTRRFIDSAQSWQAGFIMGSGFIQNYTPENQPTVVRGENRRGPFNVFNVALYVTDTGEFSTYKKAKLVPIVERFPFLPMLTRLDVYGWIDWGSFAGFGRGNDSNNMEMDTFITPGLVCYDSVYPSWVREFVSKEADFITIITNDGWWGNTSGHHQHFAYARLRAIEFDRWIVRSANNGISGVIDSKGNIHKKTDYWVRTGFNFNVPHSDSVTFYAQFGDWFSYLCLVLTAMTWPGMYVRDRFFSGSVSQSEY
ncbi:MAG: apolipoprotein N-acyltransferase [Bacteroidota bacterium]